MYKVSFVDNTTKKVGKQPASLWIKLMERDSEYWDWAWDRLLQASQDYDLIVDKSVITFCDKE
jgi:hypothetical protein